MFTFLNGICMQIYHNQIYLPFGGVLIPVKRSGLILGYIKISRRSSLVPLRPASVRLYFVRIFQSKSFFFVLIIKRMEGGKKKYIPISLKYMLGLLSRTVSLITFM